MPFGKDCCGDYSELAFLSETAQLVEQANHIILSNLLVRAKVSKNK
jgi:hypothetical protein